MRICVSISMSTDEKGNWFALIRLVELGTGEILRTVAKTYRRTTYKEAMRRAVDEGLFEARDLVEQSQDRHVLIESLVHGYPDFDIIGVRYLGERGICNETSTN